MITVFNEKRQMFELRVNCHYCKKHKFYDSPDCVEDCYFYLDQDGDMVGDNWVCFECLEKERQEHEAYKESREGTSEDL